MKKIIVALCMFCFVMGWLIPEPVRIPVRDATPADWNPHSFWYYPWGRSGTHKGIDIFARTGTPVLAATRGVVLSTGYNAMGGNYVVVLGAKWRWHYYAHLDQLQTTAGQWVETGATLGTVGTSGNAQGKAPHLHYAIYSLLPLPWQYDAKAQQAWRKMFYINPHRYLTKT